MKKIIIIIIALISFSNLQAQIAQQWISTFNGSGDYTDRFTCIAADNSGNIVAGGSTVNINQNRDYLILKMDASGVVLWRTEFNAPGNGPDEITAMEIDPNGFIYVTGFGKSNDAGNDFLTLKLDLSGNIIWQNMYDSPFHQYDQANSIALDNAGNVCVTGQGDRDSTTVTNDDYITIKYNNSGAQQWVQQFNGLGNATDRAVKVVTDISGNCYVTGRSNNGNNDDFVTIKYDANGVQQFLKYGDRNNNDRATAMATDHSSFIVVTGRSGNANDDDYYTIKYDLTGSQIWAKAFDFVDDDRSTAVAIDPTGNVYVTGQSDQDATPFRNWNYRTIKYNSAGNIVWNQTYDGAAANDDIPSSIFVNSNGAVYVTGQSDSDPTPLTSSDIVTIKYSTAGVQTWVDTYAGAAGKEDVGNAVTENSGGNCFITGFTEDASEQSNGLIVKYSNTGSSLFNYTFNGIGDNSDNIRSIAVDQAGNVYEAGYSISKLADRNYTVLKINSVGDTVWTRQVDGTSPGSDDEAYAIAIDNSGNIITGGFVKNSGTSSDYLVIKFNTNGDTLWTYLYDSPVHETDRGYAMQLDASGNIYITGRSDADPSILSNDNCVTIKLNNNGIQQWASTYASPGNFNERGTIIQVSPSGNIYVAGRTFNGTNDDILVLKYDNNGAQQWIQTYNGGNGDDVPRDMLIDANENIYITGESAGTIDTVFDYITLKYNSAGSQQWANRYDGAGQNDFAEGIASDNAGNIIVTGYSDIDAGTDTSYNIVTIKYDGSGNVVWTQPYDFGLNLNDISDAIATDAFGNIYVAAHTNKGSAADPDYDMLLLRFNTNGILSWNALAQGTADSIDVPNIVRVIGNDIYMAGSFTNTNQQRDMALIKYNGFLSVEENANSTDDATVYPNPFKDEIQFNLNNTNAVYQLEVRDAVGRIIVQQSITANTHVDFSSYESGFYTYTISDGNQIIKKGKLIHQ